MSGFIDGRRLGVQCRGHARRDKTRRDDTKQDKAQLNETTLDDTDSLRDIEYDTHGMATAPW
ncbi:protein of unknown function [Pararobbsia alpina]